MTKHQNGRARSIPAQSSGFRRCDKRDRRYVVFPDDYSAGLFTRAARAIHTWPFAGLRRGKPFAG
jgi:hypothetical protein